MAVFRLGTAVQLAEQALRAVQNFHSFAHIHRDLKPANFVLGIPPKDNKLFLIDFGMAVKYCTNPKKMPRTSVYEFIGTLRYASRTTHQGMPQSRKDDIESWFYLVRFSLSGFISNLFQVLEFFRRRILPWSDVKDTKKVAELKTQLFIEEREYYLWSYS